MGQIEQPRASPDLPVKCHAFCAFMFRGLVLNIQEAVRVRKARLRMPKFRGPEYAVLDYSWSRFNRHNDGGKWYLAVDEGMSPQVCRQFLAICTYCS